LKKHEKPDAKSFSWQKYTNESRKMEGIFEAQPDISRCEENKVIKRMFQ